MDMMFDCRVCAAKDAEIARLVSQVGELQDRLMAMVGERFQTQFTAAGPTLGPSPETEEQPEPLSETQWANEELERVAAEESRKAGGIVRDFSG
jgi:hypothetical protein